MIRSSSRASNLVRAAVASATLVLALVLPVASASAHEGHAALPDGFRAEITGIADAQGATASLDDLRFTFDPQGIGLTVVNRGSRVLEVTGEQAGEPLVRLTATRGSVNQASPQAADVRGAEVDPGAAAELIDLVWKRAPADWVDLPEGGSVFVIDHRGAPGHAPVRADYATGDHVAEFGIAFTYDGEEYRAVGAITAVQPTASNDLPLVPLAAGIALVAVVGVAVAKWRAAPTGAAPGIA